MFGRSTKQKGTSIALPEGVPFVRQLFDAIRSAPAEDGDRLEKLIDLWEKISALENAYGVGCHELEFERDGIRDAFAECNDPDSLYTCALAFGLLRNRIKLILDPDFKALPPHLRAYLLRTHILVELDGEMVDPRELDPKLQHVFFQLRQRRLGEFEFAKVLAEQYRIFDWKSRREMNPEILYTPAFPRKQP